MLKSLKELKGFAIETKDGVLGSVHDFYFDDVSWTVRYLVADTGAWLPGRRVLISPAAFLAPDWGRGVFPVRLTKKQVMNSPVIDADMPVSRRQELELSRYYHWPAYWMGSPWFAVGVPPLAVDQQEMETAERKRTNAIGRRRDPHLRGFREISSCRIEASDGALGRVVDLVVDEEGWAIRGVVVDARPWLPGGDVLLPPSRIKEIRRPDKRIVADMSRDQIKKSPAYRAGAGGVAMPTKAEWSRYHEERSGPKKQKSSRRPRRDVPVDASKPGTRNFSRRSAENAPYALEESATGTPSRKSTRKSANRSKPSHPQRRSKMFERLRARTLARSPRRSPPRRGA